MPDALLDRAAFRAAVSERDGGRCVLCGEAGSEAHHILDRKLFADGGYRVGNGALVCAPCHWDCETTRVGVAAVRAAAGVMEPVLPTGFDPDVPVDKWGNRMRDDGLREPGPLVDDDGCRRALAKGGYLGLLLPAAR